MKFKIKTVIAVLSDIVQDGEIWDAVEFMVGKVNKNKRNLAREACKVEIYRRHKYLKEVVTVLNETPNRSKKIPVGEIDLVRIRWNGEKSKLPFDDIKVKPEVARAESYHHVIEDEDGDNGSEDGDNDSDDGDYEDEDQE